MPYLPDGWRYLQSTVEVTQNYGGRESTIWVDTLLSPEYTGAYVRATQVWGQQGVVVSEMGRLPVTLYTGEPFDTNCAAIVPKSPEHLPAIWAFCQSTEYCAAVRQIDTKVNVTNATLVKVPFDLERWQKVAEEAGPLPEPYSNSPAQWLFKGDPTESTNPLQVALACLLGYCWPKQDADVLDFCTVMGGIACLPAVAGEPPATERLRALLAAAYGEHWSVAEQDRLLAEAGFAGKTLENWLRDGFFAQHCALFHN